MKEIRLTYSPLINAGDVLNAELVERLSGKKVVRSKVYNADMMAIGGALFGAQYSGGARGIVQKGMHLLYGKKPLYVWGSGFLYADNPRPLYRSNLIVCALRGQKTCEKLSSITGERYDGAVLGDAGLLVDMLLDGHVDKQYRMGLIPHFSQQNEAMFSDARKDPDIHLIDIRKTPAEVAREIASCECIVSSSLHGLIFADSLHIPSLRLIGKTSLPGGEFKFEDYYSCYGIEDDPWREADRLPGAREVADRCRIDYAVVEDKKRMLTECFPKL